VEGGVTGGENPEQPSFLVAIFLGVFLGAENKLGCMGVLAATIPADAGSAGKVGESL
jgi:hypothetical protein